MSNCIKNILEELKNYSTEGNYNAISPLFNSKEEYDEFIKRHNSEKVEVLPLEGYNKPVYIGIDAGSTTIKFVVVGSDKELLYSNYQANSGNPVPLICNHPLYTNYRFYNILLL